MTDTTTDAPTLICQCGYDLRGLADDARCPECGVAVAHSRARAEYARATARPITITAITLLFVIAVAFLPWIAGSLPGGGGLLWTVAHLEVYLGPLLLVGVAGLAAWARGDHALTPAALMVGGVFLVLELALVFPTPLAAFIYRVSGLHLAWQLVSLLLELTLILLTGRALAAWAIRIGRRGLGDSTWAITVALATVVGFQRTQLMAWVMLDATVADSFASGFARSADPPPGAIAAVVVMFLALAALAGVAAFVGWPRRRVADPAQPTAMPFLIALTLTPLWLVGLLVIPERLGALGLPDQIFVTLHAAILLVAIPWLIAILRAADRARQGGP